MKTLGPWILATALVLTASALWGAPDTYNDRLSTAWTRPGTPAAGAPTKLAATTGTPAEATLTADHVYQLVCRTDAWFELGTSTGAIAASADDIFLPANTIFYFLAGGSEGSVAISILSVAVNGSCYATKML